MPEEERRRVIAHRLKDNTWPATPLIVTAVEAETGAARTFDRHSGVDLVDAVAASCAVPLRALGRMGRNPLDPAFRAAAAEAGREQAGREADKVREVWKQK